MLHICLYLYNHIRYHLRIASRKQLHGLCYTYGGINSFVEMKSVHLWESNSPGITAECGKCVGVSDVVKGAGSAVRWSSLNWKFSVKNDENILANVASNSKLIGNASISMADIMEAQLKPNGMKEVVKQAHKQWERDKREDKVQFCSEGS